jgi:hypothetical protein
MENRAPALHVRQQAVQLSKRGRMLADPKSRTGRRTVPLIGAGRMR